MLSKFFILQLVVQPSNKHFVLHALHFPSVCVPMLPPVVASVLILGPHIEASVLLPICPSGLVSMSVSIVPLSGPRSLPSVVILITSTRRGIALPV
jgi:hypothetical protein